MTNNIDPAEISPTMCVANNLRMITRTVVQAYEEALRPSGITIAQFSTLSTIFLAGPQPIHKLAEAMALDRTTLARNLKPLERDGLVTTAPDPSDRRIKLVQLTDQGLAALEKASPLWQEAQSHFIKGLGSSQLNDLLQLFDHLRDLAQPGEPE